MLDIDPLTSVTSITVDQGRDGTYSLTLAANDYEFLPLNADKKPEPEPWTQVRLTQWGSVVSWPSNCHVKVTGIFGWAEVPEAVKSEVIELCGIWRSENPRATGRMGELDVVISSSPMAMSLLKRVRDAYHAIPTF